MTEQPVADEREVSIATMRPTLRQQRSALAIIGMLSTGFAAVALFGAKQVVRIDSFIPTVEAIILVTNLITAVLLFSQFSILGSRELLLLASGYLFSALIVIPHALSYPGAFAPKGVLGSGIQATPWLYAFWHFGFSAVVLGYACLVDTNSKKLFIHNSGAPVIYLSTGIIVMLVCALTWGVAAKEEYWPRLLANEVDFTPLANPGGSITGISDNATTLATKRLSLIKQAVPRVTKVAMLWNRDDLGMSMRYEASANAARSLGTTVQALGVREPDDFKGVFEAMDREPPDAIFMVADGLTTLNRKRVIDYAAMHHIPAMYEYDVPNVTDGGLMSYGPDVKECMASAAELAARILGGARPADLPFEEPTRYKLVINLKTAKATDITLPENFVALADEVIE